LSYDVTNPRAITEIVIPFFNKYKFQSASKKYNFRLFSEVAVMMDNKDHLSSDGLRRILIIREKLNPGRGRTRKYSIDDVKIIGESSTTIRQAPLNRG